MLKIHFLNVGHGDCCIIEFLDNNRIAIVDINRSTDMDNESLQEIASAYALPRNPFFNTSLTESLFNAGYQVTLQDPIKYIKDENMNTIWRFISTHPHMDHLSGLSELKNEINFNNIWILKNNYTQDYSKLSESQKKDWELYKDFRDTDSRDLYNTNVIRPDEGAQQKFYEEDGIRILAPNNELINLGDKNANEMSYVLLITHRGRKIILSGDAEENTWKYLMDNYEDELTNISIFKAAHHGRDSGYYQPAVKKMSPIVTIVSVGKKPETDATNKYKQYSENVWSTRWKGNIVLTIKDDGSIEYYTQYDR